MNMKKKIRKAFHAATPNVLGRILDDCPTAERKAAVPASPAPKKRNIPHWARELIATAAAFALLIAVAGGAYVYIRSLTPGTGDENPTGFSTEAPSHSDPVVSDLEQDLAAQVRALVCPEGTATNYEGFDLVVTMEPKVGEPYLFTAQYKGYTYNFSFSASGKLYGLVIPINSLAKEGYISELVAQEIVKLSFLSDPDMVGISGCSLVTMNDVTYYHIRGNIVYMSSIQSFYVNATTGELSTPDISIPDGNIGVDLAVETALDSVDLHRDAVKNLNCVKGHTQEGNLCYVVTFINGSTLYEIGVGAYNPSVLYCNSTAVTPITESQALQIAQEYLSAHLADLWRFEVIKDIDGGYSIHYGVGNTSGVIALDQYGYLQGILGSDDPVTEPSNAEDRIGWRVARDIALAINGMELEEVHSLSCRFVYRSSKPYYYEITIDGDIIELVEAQSGWLYREGDSDGSPSYNTTILTRTEALTLVLQDIGGEVAEKWLGGGYDEGQSECVLRYAGGDPGRNQTKLEYTVTVWIEDYTYVYTLDAYTGTIHVKYVGTLKEDDTDIPVTEPDPTSLSYTISEYSYSWKPYLEVNTAAIIVSSVSELTALCGGSLQAHPAVHDHDEAFFAEHSLIIVHFVSGGGSFTVLPGALTVNDDGSYNLELNYYAQQIQSAVIVSKQLVLEVDRPLDPEAELTLSLTSQFVIWGNFRHLFESKSELESVSYQVIDSDYRPEKGGLLYAQLRTINSYEQLSELADGMIPENAGIDEKFFEEHSLIIVEYGSSWEKHRLVPGELTQGENGTLYLELEEYFCPGMCSTLGYELLIYAVDQALAPEAEVLVLYSNHELSADEYDKMFP